VFSKTQYTSDLVPDLLTFKHRWFGHEATVLHAHEIRKAEGEFKFLFKREVREAFMDGINAMMTRAPFTLIASAIHKQRLAGRYHAPENPYSLALGFCLERCYRMLKDLGQDDRLTHVIVEARGKKEDLELEAVFRRICDGSNALSHPLPFDIKFVDKKMNLAGLQIADFVCQPIARHLLNPAQPNRAFEIIQEKFRKGNNGKYKGYGLKVFP